MRSLAPVDPCRREEKHMADLEHKMVALTAESKGLKRERQRLEEQLIQAQVR